MKYPNYSDLGLIQKDKEQKKKSIKPVKQEIIETVYMLSESKKTMINMTDTDWTYEI